MVDPATISAYGPTGDVRAWLRGKVTVKPTGCWWWQGCTTEKGYGYATILVDGRKRNMRAHRLAYLAYVGPIPDDLVLDHLCRVPWCCNPSHVEPVTPRENVRRGLVARGYQTPQKGCTDE